METPGFRWCPVTLSSVGALHPDSPQALCTPEGLTTKDDILVMILPRIDVSEGMDTRLLIHVPSVGGFYCLQDLLESLPRDGLRGINPLLLEINELNPLPVWVTFTVVAVDIREGENVWNTRRTDTSPLQCQYVTRTRVMGYGDTWDYTMEGRPVVEGRLVKAKVTVT